MSVFLAVDPDLRNPGVALFRDDALIKCGVAVNAMRSERGPVAWTSAEAAVSAFLHDAGLCPTHLAIEYPRIYPIHQQVGDQADLLELAGVVGAISTIFSHHNVTAYWPHEWKGTVKKDVMQDRILGRLSPSELALIPSLNANLRSDVVDAIGIGLHHLGRLARRRVYPRE